MNYWNVTNNRYISFIDIMGFTDYVYRNSHATVKKRMDKFHSIVLENENDIKGIAVELSNINEAIKSVIFSDSIILLSIDDSVESLEYMLLAAQCILTSCIESKIPIKGAISYGTITADFDKSLYFGKGLIDAYSLENIVEMYGIILDNKVEKQLQKTKFDYRPYCCTKKVPTKSGHIRHIAIDWISWAKKFGKDPIHLIQQFYSQTSGHPRKYIDNTLDFIKLSECETPPRWLKESTEE